MQILNPQIHTQLFSLEKMQLDKSHYDNLHWNLTFIKLYSFYNFCSWVK